MHEKLVKQLRNSEHCNGCPYNEDCNEFDTCLIDLLAADAIEDMSKRIIRQEKDKCIKNEEYLFGKDWQVEQDIKEMAHMAASKTIWEITSKDGSGKLLYYFMKKLQALSKLSGYKGDKEYRFYVITEDEYRELTNR